MHERCALIEHLIKEEIIGLRESVLEGTVMVYGHHIGFLCVLLLAQRLGSCGLQVESARINGAISPRVYFFREQ